MECTYGFLTWVNHAGIYVELLDAGKLHFTIEEWFGGVCVNKQIFGELAELLCDFFVYTPSINRLDYWLTENWRCLRFLK